MSGHSKNSKNSTDSNVDVAPILFGTLKRSLGKDKRTTIKILLDSGASSTLISHDVVKKLRIKPETATDWTTAAGTFATSGKCNVIFQLPELSPSADIQYNMHVFKGKIPNYDMIIGRDLLKILGIDPCFSDETIKWPKLHAEIPMKRIDATVETAFYVQEPAGLNQEVDRMSHILDAKYSKADLHQVAQEATGLTEAQKVQLERLLLEYETTFDGTLGTWEGDPYKIQLREDVKPFHARPFSVPKAYERTLKLEIERLCKIGVLKRVNRSEWASPSFIIPKKDGTVRFINDFREVNKRIKRMPFPIPKIQDLLLKLEGFQFATSLDLIWATTIYASIQKVEKYVLLFSRGESTRCKPYQWVCATVRTSFRRKCPSLCGTLKAYALT